jgi:hypothetical protein
LQYSIPGAAQKNERVVSILKHGTRGIRDNGMFERGRKGWVMEETTENIGDNDEEIR